MQRSAQVKQSRSDVHVIASPQSTEAHSKLSLLK